MGLHVLRLSIVSFFLSGLLCLQAIASPPPPEAFGQLPNFYDASLSPDGQKIAVIVNLRGDYYIRVLKTKGKFDKPILVKLNKGVKPLWIKWANNEQVLTAFWQSETLQRTKLKTGYIYTYNYESKKGKILVRPDRDLFRQFNHIVVDWLEDDPDHILMAYSDVSQLKSPDLYKVHVVTGHDERVQRSLRDTQYWLTDHRGTPRVAYGQRDDAVGTKVMRIRRSDSSQWEEASDFPGLNADSQVFGFTSNLDEMVIGNYAGKETLGLYVYDLKTRSIGRKIYHNDTYDVSGIVLSANGEDIVGARFVGDTNETVLLDGKRGLIGEMEQKFPGYQIDYVDMSQNGDSLLFRLSSPYDPGSLMFVERGHSPESLGAYYDDLDSNDLGDVIALKYTARDGQKIPAYVTIPPMIRSTADLKKIPFIVLPHGGPYARDNKRFDYFAQFFVSRGYGVLQMNFRGSEGYGKSFKSAGRKNWVVMQEDVEDGARFLIDKGYADPNRLCIAGWSFGGYAALLGAAKQGDLYKCAISMAGLTDIPSFVSNRKRYQFGRSASKKFVLNGFESKDDIKENSPYRIAEDITIPLFLAHGEDDQAVYFTQYKKMKSALKKSPANVTYMPFKDGDHYLSDQANRVKFFRGLDRFLMEVNGKSEFAR